MVGLAAIGRFGSDVFGRSALQDLSEYCCLCNLTQWFLVGRLFYERESDCRYVLKALKGVVCVLLWRVGWSDRILPAQR